MDLDQAIELVRKAISENSVNNKVMIDFGLLPTEERPKYEKALAIAKLAVLDGKITQAELMSRLHLE